MGRKEKWYSQIKKVLSPGSSNLRIKTQAKQSSSESRNKHVVHPVESVAVQSLPQVEDVVVEPNNDELNTVSEITAELAPKITLEIMRRTTLIRHAAKSKEDEAAIQLQTAYRGYLARRTLRALRGLVRLKFLAQGQAVQPQAANTLKCMQALARVQSQVRSRTLVSKENQALRKQLLQKSGKKHTAFRISEDWKDCAQSKEQEESKLKKRHEAALRRERSLAYSSVHQKTWKNSPKRMSSDTTVTDSDNPSWGWSWLERWMQTAATEGPDSTQEITEVQAQSTHKPPPSIKVTPTSHVNPALKVASMAENSKPGSTRTRLSNASGSDNSEKNRRQSFAGSSARDYTRSAAPNSPRSHTIPAKSPITRPKSQSPLGMDHDRTPRKSTSVPLAEKPSSRLAPPPSNTTRRHSAPPKVRNMTLTQQNQKITA